MTPPENGSQNQSLLELIYAIKNLASNLEHMHTDVKRSIENESRERRECLERLNTQLQTNQQAIASIPVLVADRVEADMAKRVDSILDETRRALDDMRMKLWVHLGAPRSQEASGSGMTSLPPPLPPLPPKSEHVTGQFTLMDNGNVKLEGNAESAKKVYRIIKIIIGAVLGGTGTVGLAKFVVDALLHNHPH